MSSRRKELFVGDLTEENVIDDDKPLDSVALAKFLSKAAKVNSFLSTHWVTSLFGLVRG